MTTNTTITSVKLVRGYSREDGARLLVNDTEIANVNYDEHGSVGEDVLEQVMNGLAKLANVFPVQEEEDFG